MYFQDKDKLSSNLDVLKSITAYWDDLNKSITETTKNFGQTFDSFKVAGSYTNVLNKNFSSVAARIQSMGVDAKIASQFIGEMSDYTGTMVGFASEGLVKYAALQDLLGKTNVDTVVQGLNDMGVGMSKSIEYMSDMQDQSMSLGLNAKKVATTFVANFKSAAAISFKGGVDQLSKMAKQSVMFGGNMADVLEIADKLRNPEQAIEFTQNMQMLGGELANQFSDVASIMYEARNEPEKLAERINKASGSLVSFNKQTGKMELLSENYDKAKLMANQFGLSMDDIIKRGEKVKKLDIFKSTFQGITDDQANILTGFANFGKGGTISLEGLEKQPELLKKAGIDMSQLSDITNLSTTQMKDLVEGLKKTEEGEDKKNKTAEDQLKALMTNTESISALKSVIQASSMASNELSKNINTSTGLKGVVQNSQLEKSFENLSMVTVGFAKIIVGEVTPALKDLSKVINQDLEDITTGKKQPPKKGETTNTTTNINPIVDPNMPKKKKKGSIIEKNDSMGYGGVFKGPSHAEGGIQALNKSNGKMLEVEGGEAIINKKSTEMFKPLLSKLNEAGGGVKFAEGGITPVDLENIMSKMGSMTNTSNINVGSNSPVNVNVNVNGSISIDGKDFTIPEDEKEKLSKNLIKEVMIKVNSEIGQSTIFTGGKRKTADNTFNY